MSSSPDKQRVWHPPTTCTSIFSSPGRRVFGAGGTVPRSRPALEMVGRAQKRVRVRVARDANSWLPAIAGSSPGQILLAAASASTRGLLLEMRFGPPSPHDRSQVIRSICRTRGVLRAGA
jgi:hypothetical protein